MHKYFSCATCTMFQSSNTTLANGWTTKVQYKLILQSRALYIKRHKEKKQTEKTDHAQERERSREKAQGAKKAKPERETERRRRSAEEERKAEDKRRARQKVEPHSNFLFFFAVAFIFLYHSAGSPKAMSSSLPRVTPRGSHQV